MSDWKSSLRADPTELLVEQGSPPVAYRTLSEILRLPDNDPRLQKARGGVAVYKPALKLARLQRKDGSWGGAIGIAGSAKPFLSTEFCLSMLFEYGWDRTAPPVRKSSKLLKSFLTERRDLSLYEYQTQVKADDLRQRYYRWFLRITALGLLMRSGYGGEDRVFNALLGLVERVAQFVDSPISKHPTEGSASRLSVFRREAMQDCYVFIPDLHLLSAFAHSPRLLESDELKRRLKKIADYVISDPYQALGSQIGLVKTARGTFPKKYGIELREVEHYLKAGTLDYLLTVLEIFARLGLINRYPLLMGYLEWLINQQEKDGRWTFGPKVLGGDERAARLLRLDVDWRSPVRRGTDLTFRIALILKLQWERQIKMLDRGEDAYPF
jgi:hypothetical protein